mgnify:CR=1 FL=1
MAAHATSRLTAIGATFFSIEGTKIPARACALIVTLLNAAPKILREIARRCGHGCHVDTACSWRNWARSTER